jgi:hypothetical protein
VMVHGRNGDSGCVQFQIASQQLVNSCKHRDRVLSRGFGGARSVRLDGGNQRNPQAGGLQFAIDAEVVAAKGAGPGNGDTQNGLAGYAAAPGSGPWPSTAFRQRL